MSLISTASVWTNDDVPKKRIPTIRKTLKKTSSYEPEEYVSTETSSLRPPQNTIEDSQKKNETRNLRVNEIINQLNENNEGNGLSDYHPLPNTILHSNKTDMETTSLPLSTTTNNNNTNNTTDQIYPEYLQRKNNSSNHFSSNSLNLANLSSYNKSYEAPVHIKNKPYYTSFGIGGGGGGTDMDHKFMEKINYIVHMLEDIQGEKTNNIMEEFILYSLLGIFMIFLVDSFSKTTKYVR